MKARASALPGFCLRTARRWLSASSRLPPRAAIAASRSWQSMYSGKLSSMPCNEHTCTLARVCYTAGKDANNASCTRLHTSCQRCLRLTLKTMCPGLQLQLAYLVLPGSRRHITSGLPHACHVEAHRQAGSCWAVCCSLQRCSITFALTPNTVLWSSCWLMQCGSELQGESAWQGA